MTKKATKLAPVVRDDKARVVTGSLNPGGITKEQRAARDALNKWLCAAPQMEMGKAAYTQLLQEGNPVIVKDFMDRVAGKVKETLNVQDDRERPFAGMSPEALLAALRGEK